MLLNKEKINPQVLAELEITTNASTAEDIQKNYEEAMLNVANSIVLPSSGFTVCFGHISAYTYLNEIYGVITELQERGAETVSDSDTLQVGVLTILKYFLLPRETDQGIEYLRVRSISGMREILYSLNEIDSRVLLEIVGLMRTPYEYTFELKNIVCPKCRNRTETLVIEDMSRMLFMIAQSLSNVTVTLNRN
jgi:hypothetical protein